MWVCSRVLDIIDDRRPSENTECWGTCKMWAQLKSSLRLIQQDTLEYKWHCGEVLSCPSVREECIGFLPSWAESITLAISWEGNSHMSRTIPRKFSLELIPVNTESS